MKEYTYHAMVNDPVSSPEDPSHLVRVDNHSRYPEALRPDGRWTPALTWMSMMRGDATYEPLELTRAQALDVARRWRARGHLSKIPRDLRRK